MTEIYKSKIGSPIKVPLYMVGGMFIAMIFVRAWPAIIVTGIVTAYLTHVYFNTYYTIIENKLLIKSGLIINKTIDIASIKRIKATIDMSSAPALSTDRLEITYSQDKFVFVSPEDKEGFIAQLKAVNEGIVVD